jgi:hypothetical protein
MKYELNKAFKIRIWRMSTVVSRRVQSLRSVKWSCLNDVYVVYEQQLLATYTCTEPKHRHHFKTTHAIHLLSSRPCSGGHVLQHLVAKRKNDDAPKLALSPSNCSLCKMSRGIIFLDNEAPHHRSVINSIRRISGSCPISVMWLDAEASRILHLHDGQHGYPDVWAADVDYIN